MFVSSVPTDACSGGHSGAYSAGCSDGYMPHNDARFYSDHSNINFNFNSAFHSKDCSMDMISADFDCALMTTDLVESVLKDDDDDDYNDVTTWDDEHELGPSATPSSWGRFSSEENTYDSDVLTYLPGADHEEQFVPLPHRLLQPQKEVEHQDQHFFDDGGNSLARSRAIVQVLSLSERASLAAAVTQQREWLHKKQDMMPVGRDHGFVACTRAAKKNAQHANRTNRSSKLPPPSQLQKGGLKDDSSGKRAVSVEEQAEFAAAVALKVQSLAGGQVGGCQPQVNHMHGNQRYAKFCPHCGKPIKDFFQFCSRCGNNLAGMSRPGPCGNASHS